jgi:hypothetical protein
MRTIATVGSITLCGSAMLVGQFNASAGEGTPGEQLPAGADVIVGDLDMIMKHGGVTVGGVMVMAYSVGTVSCNIGSAQLEWFASPNNRHPFIPQNMYRFKGGRFEQIGMGWGKHGFTALQQSLCGSCSSSGTGNYLGVGCSDPYSASLNGNQSGLGTRSEVNAATGVFPGSYNAGMPSSQATIGRRIQVRQPDLDPAQNAGAQYVVEGHYIAQDDAAAGNDNNNASWRAFTVGTFSNNSYTLNVTGSTQRQSAAIFAWKTFEPDVKIDNVDVPGDGRFHVGFHVIDNGNGTWRYEYAIHNMNSHRAGRAFSVQVPAGVNVTGVGFKDINYHSGDPFDPTDWSSSVSGGAVTWTGGTFSVNPNGNALRFATQYNFWFTADQPPAVVNATLGLFRPGAAGAPDSVALGVFGPQAPPPLAGDIDGNGTVNGIDLGLLLGAWGNAGPGDINGDGSVDGLDLGLLLSNWG